MRKILIIAAMFAIANGAFAQNRSINFETGSFAEVKEKAKNENKLMFIDFYTSWCGPCKRMEKYVFMNDTVADYYNQNFVCARIDAEKGEGIELAKKYYIVAYPTFVFLDPFIDKDTSILHDMVHRACGFRDAKSFVKIGMDALDQNRQLSKVVNDYLKSDRSADFASRMIDSLSAACVPVQKMVDDYLKNQNDSDFSSESNWHLINLYVQDVNSREMDYLMKNQEKFNLLYGDSAVSSKIYTVYLNNFETIARDTSKDRENKYLSLRERISSLNFKGKDKLLIEAGLSYYQTAGDWSNLVKVATMDNITEYVWDEEVKLNNLSWDFYEHIDDIALLERALKWSKRSIEIEVRHGNYDTYAHLLYKLGRIDEAIDAEKKALELANGLENPKKDYQDALNKFQNKE